MGKIVEIMDDGTIKGYITVTELSLKWGVSPGLIRHLQSINRIKESFKIGSKYYYPIDLEKPQNKKAGRPKGE